MEHSCSVLPGCWTWLVQHTAQAAKGSSVCNKYCPEPPSFSKVGTGIWYHGSRQSCAKPQKKATGRIQLRNSLSALVPIPLGICRTVPSGVCISELRHWGQLGPPVRGCPLPKSFWHVGLPLQGQVQALPVLTSVPIKPMPKSSLQNGFCRLGFSSPLQHKVCQPSLGRESPGPSWLACIWGWAGVAAVPR